ncbi:DUF2933 domain-containing protein [Desulforamulus aeronauticus]|uniref:DUF2933 domain-containing protein n=1 Tax=Desulforamulus aeronauticus DSM 10349 TaxID=1121421 RepID=A0A1M6X5T4_9FIRM|nr:DUF2933 domain-containing protein [Desulforamulus aeronauticus]SHL01274.1 Protein of unknown function [Desulforamulus aeronauticus DSM 10349]
MEKYLPYLILLLCPIMHLFMMRGHKHHANQETPQAVSRQRILKVKKKVS